MFSQNKSYICYFALCLLFLLPTSCSNGGNGSGAPGTRGLIQSDASNAILDSLIGYGYSFEQFTGSQDMSNFDFLVIDADTHSPDELASTELLIDEAFEAEKPLLLLDADATHIDEGLRKHIGISTDGNHYAYLVLTKRNGDGELEHTAVAYRHPEAHELHIDPDANAFETDDPELLASFQEADTQEKEKSVSHDEVTQAHANSIMNFIQEHYGLDSSLRRNLRESDVFSVGQPIEGVVGGKTQKLIVTETFTVYPEQRDISKIKNDLLYTLSAWAYYDPNDEYYKIIFNNSGTAYVSDSNLYHSLQIPGVKEIKFYLFQRGLDAEIRCLHDGAVILQSSPPNANNVSTYTDSVSSTIGVSVSTESAGVSVSKTVSHSVTKSISDWSLENTASSFREGTWKYFQSDSNTKHYRYSSLPALSRENMDYSNSTVWQIHSSDIPDNRQITFSVKIKRYFGAAAKKSGGINIGGSYSHNDRHFTITLPEPNPSQ